MKKKTNIEERRKKRRAKYPQQYNKKILLLLIFIVIVLTVNTVSAQVISKDNIDIELIKNTDYCDENCYSEYKICYTDGISQKITELDFKYKTEENGTMKGEEVLKEAPKITPSLDIDPNCRIIKIEGKKNKYENIDNIPCFNKVCWEEFTWWNSNWKYKEKFNVNSTITLTNYQVKLIINLTNLYNESKINSDCSDLRFTVNDTTEIDYFIEYCNVSGEDSIIWIEAPNINGTYEMYYGNPNISVSASDGWNTFLFFDDFEYSDSIENHYWDISSGSVFTTPETSQLGDRSLKVTGNAYKNFTIFLQEEEEVWLDINFNAMTYNEGLSTETWWYYEFTSWAFLGSLRDSGQYSYNTGVAYVDILNTANATWYKIRFYVNLTDDSYDIYIDDVNELDNQDFASSLTAKNITHLRIFSSGAGIGFYDYFHAFKNATGNEPVYNFSGIEEEFITNISSVTFNVVDSISSSHLSGINMVCNGQGFLNKTSPYIISLNYSSYTCNFSVAGYQVKTENFQMNDPNEEFTVLMIAIVPTVEEIGITFISDLTELYPHHTCVGNILVREWNETFCLDNNCSDIRRTQSYPCQYGCYDNVTVYGSECFYPEWSMYILAGSIIIFMLFLFAWLTKGDK